MASRIKVDEVTNLNGSGSVSFPTGGASFQGNVGVTGNIDFSGQLLQNGQPFVTLFVVLLLNSQLRWQLNQNPVLLLYTFVKSGREHRKAAKSLGLFALV